MSKKVLLIFFIVVFLTTVCYIFFITKSNKSVSHDPSSSAIESCKFPESDGSLSIDFNKCTECAGTKYVGFGSTHYKFTGIENNNCVFDFGGEVENPNWDGKLDTHCEVPTSVGEIKFQVTNYGVNFSSISNYCN